MLGRGERILVTADSASMVNEAVAAGKPVATIAPVDRGPDAFLDGMLARLESTRRLIRLPGTEWNLADIPDTRWSMMEPDWHVPLGRILLDRIQPILKKNA